ncbi:MAG: ABC transporter permease [Chloroflexaceae bacterium]|nr:ABC transporter permease [Chloroflexaceae bacterium]
MTWHTITWQQRPQHYEQYLSQLGRIVFAGELGSSYLQPDKSVQSILLVSMTISGQIGFIALIISSSVGIIMGVLISSKHGKVSESIFLVLSYTLISVPEYITAPLFILILSLQLRLVPTSGWEGILSPNIIIPLMVLSLRPTLVLALYVRASMIEIMSKDFVRTAIAKGLHNRRVLFIHCFRNAVIAIVNVFAANVSALIVGSFYVEVAYGIPGFGRVFINSVLDRDYPVILGAVLVTGFLVCVMNFAADIITTLLDPRLSAMN